MSALPKPVLSTKGRRNETSNTLNATFLKFLPAVQTHAKIQFRHLPPVDREEAIAEATAAAFVNFHAAHQHGKLKAVTPSTLAHFAILHARSGRRIGGGSDNSTDVLSRQAQRVRGFQVLPLPTQSARRFDCLTAPDQPVWREVLLHDKQTPVADQAAFRLDWSAFLAKQTDRTRTAIASLAAGYKRCEVADQLGVTPPALTQRMRRVWRDWNVFQGEGGARAEGQAAVAPGKPATLRKRTPERLIPWNYRETRTFVGTTPDTFRWS